MLSNKKSIHTCGGKHEVIMLTSRAAAMVGWYNIRAAPEPEDCMSSVVKHRLPTLKIYELRRIFDNFLFIKSIVRGVFFFFY